MAILDTLLPMLMGRFPQAGIRLESGEPRRATIPAAHPDVGEIVLQDDGHEITAFIGRFTHSHFSNYDDIPESEKEQVIAEDVAQFLEDLFADRVVMWGSHDSGGGWRSIDYGDAPQPKRNEYVWTGPRNV